MVEGDTAGRGARSSPRRATSRRRRSRRGSPPSSTVSTSSWRMSRTRRTTPRASSSCRKKDVRAPADNGPVITTFIFRVRNVPAALYKAMGGFATNGVNMTKLESYQLEGQFFATQFYADVDGHPDERPLALAWRSSPSSRASSAFSASTRRATSARDWRKRSQSFWASAYTSAARSRFSAPGSLTGRRLTPALWHRPAVGLPRPATASSATSAIPRIAAGPRRRTARREPRGRSRRACR